MRLFARTLLVLALAASAAPAQSDADLVRARKLYSQGVTQEAASDWAGALATFEEVSRIKLTPQVRFHIARCKERIGRLNEALGGYRMAEYEANGAGDKERELLTEVKKAREELEARIPKLKIVRGKDADALKIELDGVVLGDTQVGQEIALDPGPHVVTGVVAPGKRFKKEVRLAERDRIEVVLDVPEELRSAEAPAPPVVDSGKPPSEPMDAPPADQAPPPKTHSASAAPWIVGGLGVASLAASAVFFGMRKNAEQQLSDQCIGRTCPDTLRDTQSRGETYAALSGVTLAVGIAGVGAATLMLLGRSSSPEPSATASIQLGHRGLGVHLGGHF
jgi:hypothetical protein